MFGPKRNHWIRDWRRLRNEELHNLYSSPNIIWVTKSIRTRWTGHWHVWGRTGVETGFWCKNLIKEIHRLRVFDCSLLRKMFGPKGNHWMRDWRRLRNEELHNLYSSPNIIWVTKSRKTRWTGHWLVWGRTGVETGFWCKNLIKRDNLQDVGVDGRIILKSIFNK